MNSENKTIRNLAAVLVIVATLLTSLDAIFKLSLWKKITLWMERLAGVLWLQAGLAFIVFIVLFLLLCWLWRPDFWARMANDFSEERISLLLKVLLSVALIAAGSLGIVFLFYGAGSGEYEVSILFPHLARLGPAYLRTYASNGESFYSFFRATPLGGPDGYVKTTLRTYGHTVDYNAGLIVLFLRGLDISKYQQIRFMIRGESGREKIGLKVKDARGVEVFVDLDENYLTEGEIGTDWQIVSVPLRDFGNVDFSLMDNISFFIDGAMAGTRPQTVYLGGFQLK